jgi:hypothetical protein
VLVVLVFRLEASDGSIRAVHQNNADRYVAEAAHHPDASGSLALPDSFNEYNCGVIATSTNPTDQAASQKRDLNTKARKSYTLGDFARI